MGLGISLKESGSKRDQEDSQGRFVRPQRRSATQLPQTVPAALKLSQGATICISPGLPGSATNCHHAAVKGLEDAITLSVVARDRSKRLGISEEPG